MSEDRGQGAQTSMAEAAQADPAPIAETQPAPIVTSIDGLDAAMAAARQSATAQQADLEADQAAQERTPSSNGTTQQPAPVQPVSEDDAQEDGEESVTEPNADPTQPPKPSRMGRLREQLTQAEQAKRDVETRLNERLGADLKVRQKYAALLGTPEERTQLEAVLANPQSPDFEVRQARTRLGQMRQATEELAPLYTAVEQDVFQGFIRGLEGLRTLDGMDESAHQSLYKATSGVEALKLMHGIGQKAAEEQFKGEIASLKAQVSDLKTRVAARGQQPANGGGLASGTASGLAGLLGVDGLPTEEAIARARAGGLRHVGAPAAA